MLSIGKCTETFVAGVLGTTLLVSMAVADTKGTTLPDIKDICEREKVQKCRWEGDRHICEWVDGPNCLVTRTTPGSNRIPKNMTVLRR